MSDADELRAIAADLRRLVLLDAADDAPGYAPLASSPAPSAPSHVAPLLAPAAAADPPPTRQERPDLAALRTELGDCTRCKLCGLGRTHIVFGEGSPDADVLFAGEGPGFNEDQQGRPFVGPAGELLDKMIGAMGLRRQDVYICNVVKCRPPGNRDPEPDEVVACQPFLLAQVRSVRPKVVVALGRFAAQTLLNTTESISRLRGRFHPYFETKLMPTFHPAYLLRNPGDKRKVWEDLQLVMAELGLTRSGDT